MIKYIALCFVLAIAFVTASSVNNEFSILASSIEQAFASDSDPRPAIARAVAEWALPKLEDASSLEKIVRLFEEEYNPDLNSPMLDITPNEVAKTPALFDEYVNELVSEYLEEIDLVKDRYFNQDTFTPPEKNPYPYWSFIPPTQVSVVPGGDAVTWETPCFKENTASAISTVDDDGNTVIQVTIKSRRQNKLKCLDPYLIGTVNNINVKGVFFLGTHTFNVKVHPKQSDAELWDVMNKGIRIMRFLQNPIQTIIDVVDTASLFVQPLTMKHPSKAAAKRNIYFLENYTNLKPVMTPRETTDVEIDESTVQSGDFFGIVRLDGLDPMLAWAMGSTTGHTTVAIRDPKDNSLYIAESTSKDSYWPTNGIQKTPFKLWLKQAKEAGFQVVHAPLTQSLRDAFDVNKALEWFSTVEGLNYGYFNLLYGWIDTPTDNYPCLPPNFDVCLEWSHIELLDAWVTKLVPVLGNTFFNQAFNHRLNTTDLSPAEIFYKADELGIAPGILPTIPEQDTWLYKTSRNGEIAEGRSMVCCVFVCSMWKAGGLFGEDADNINCGELTNWDVYSLTFFDESKIGDGRPQACIDADPDNDLCQLLGDYTLNLNDFNTKDIYPHIAERCPSKSPDYPRVAGC